MALPDIAKYDDEKLEALAQAVSAEQQKRRDLANIPHQIASLKAKFVEGGGDPSELEV